MPSLKHWLAFNRISGLGPVKFKLLEAYFGDLADAWPATSSSLAAAGLEPELVEQIVRERRAIDPDAEVDRVARAGLQTMAKFSPGYPALLSQIHDPPPVLYVKGSLPAVDVIGITVVGTRTPTPYGREVGLRMATELAAAGMVIVSGLARGIDGIAHRAALDVGAKTVAVLGSGPDLIYPHEHRRLAEEICGAGALISEFPPGHGIEPGNFPRRNRILSGLTKGTLVVEAGHKSGASTTASHALDQNRDVFAVPGSILSEKSAGPHRLIQQGAKLVTCASDVLDEYRLARSAGQLSLGGQVLPADESERKVLTSVTDEPRHIDELIRASGLPSATVSAALAMMELRGLVRQSGPLHYSRMSGRIGSDDPLPG
jgi:DNA processing protein